MVKKIIWFFNKYNFLLKQMKNNNYEWKKIIDETQNSLNKLNNHQLKKAGLKIYDLLLTYYLTDLKLDKNESINLNSIISYFNLPNKKISAIKKRYSKKTIEKLIELKLSDKILTDSEKNEIYDLSDHLEFSKDLAKSIIKNNAVKILNNEIIKVKEDRRLTPVEEKELVQLVNNLGLKEYKDEIISNKDKQELAYYKLLYEVESGNLPEISSPIPLLKNEICHYNLPATRLESKIVTVGHTRASRGVSIRIMKGVSYRVGSFRSQPIKQEVTYKYPGDFVITNKKIVFTGREKGFSIPINKVTTLDPYSNGIGIQKDKQYYLLQFNGQFTELVGMIITKAINKY